MTLDEGIIHAKDVARNNHEAATYLADEHPTQAEKCEECAREHEQLAEWLKELKTLKVSRKELLNDIDTAIKATNMDDAYSVGLRNGMRVIKSFIDGEKPEYEKCCHEESRSENPNKWIPVSERVPEDGEEVLCFLGSEEMAVLFRRNDWGQDEWVDGGFATGSYDVVAWMPLPLPFRAESEVDS